MLTGLNVDSVLPSRNLNVLAGLAFVSENNSIYFPKNVECICMKP